MAIYQYRAFLVPRACLTALGSGAHEPLAVLDIVERCWTLHQLPVDPTPLLQSALPRGEFWTDSLEVWGDLRSSCVEVSREAGRIDSLSFRVDARQVEPSFLDSVVALAEHTGCVFLEGGGGVVEADVASLRAALERSRAYLYCTDREEYFRALDAHRGPNR